MSKDSRTKNSIRNSSISIITQIITLVMDFFVKTIFINVLGSEYLGINGLFANIITLLSLADLGIGVAIPYSLYRPLANGDTKRIQALMNYYRRIYNIIGFTVLGIGLSLTPFLNLIIKDMPNIPGLHFIYILFVTHSALSYFFVYKRFLIESDQKGYIISKITFVCSLLLNIVRVTLLLLTKNFILYLFCSIVFVLIQNFWYSHKANKMYPYIKEKNNETISEKDRKEISKNISALFIYKVGGVITNGTDNIVISKFIGLVAVGVYSNYILIVNSLDNLLIQLFNSITSSVGNLVATNNERSKYIFEKLNFFNFYIYSQFGICLFVLINPFMNIWLNQDYTLSFWVALLLAGNFYISGMQSVTNTFRTAYGLFYKARFRPVLMVIINLVASVILVGPFGIPGVIGGTIISRVLTVVWIDPYVIYKYGFKDDVKEYYKKFIYYFIISILSAALLYYIGTFFDLTNLFIWILYAFIIIFSYKLIIFLIFRKTEEYIFFKEKTTNIINKIKRRFA